MRLLEIAESRFPLLTHSSLWTFWTFITIAYIGQKYHSMFSWEYLGSWKLFCPMKMIKENCWATESKSSLPIFLFLFPFSVSFVPFAQQFHSFAWATFLLNVNSSNFVILSFYLYFATISLSMLRFSNIPLHLSEAMQRIGRIEKDFLVIRTRAHPHFWHSIKRWYGTYECKIYTRHPTDEDYMR